ncbi:MAG: LamG-like jellyroll fold domain-containing protein, partial [Verrucomicrobiales bacterium]
EIADLNSAAPPAAGLQAHWNFDDASGSLAADASGNGWFGVLTNMEIRDSDWVPAPPTAFANNTALAFDGVNEYVETTYPGIGGTGARTVAFWVKTTDMADNGLLGWGDEAPNGRKWHLRINSDAANGTVGAIRTEVQGGNNIGTTVIADGQWHHVACVWEDDGTPDIADAIHYIDGVAETPSFTTDEPIDTDIAGANALPVWIGGRRQGAAFRYIDGQMDDVRIYSRALSAAEVAGLMSAAPAADGLEAHWAFDAGVGSQAADASGNGFTGVLRNMETGEDSGWSIDVPPVLDPPAASLSFNGEGGHVLTGYVGIVESNPRSVSVWVKTTDTADHGILAWGDSNTNGAKWHLRVNTSAAEGAVGAFRIEGQGGQIVGTTYIADGQWHHLACVFAPDDTPTLHDTRLYVDGVLEPATTGGDVAVNTVVLDPVTIGKRIQGAVHRPFAGLVSQAAIFSAPLDADQVAALFTGAAKPDDVVSFAGTLGLDLDAAMRGQNSSAFLRYDFSTPTDFGFDHLELRLRYDAGLIAYLNGAEVYRDNAPAAPAWDAAATGGRTDAAALVPHSTNISGAGGSLVPGGENTLALHSLNESAGDADFLAGAELVAITVTPGAAGYFAQPTPGGPNGTAAFEGLVGDTTFSVDRGFFTAPFDLEIATPATEGAAIYYTTDGSVPTPANGTLYAGPVAIGTTTVLRAAAFRDGFIQSNVDTQTYLFLDQVAAQSAAPPPGFPAAWDHQGGTREADYEMDPDLVGPVYTTQQVVASLPDAPDDLAGMRSGGPLGSAEWILREPGLRGGL